MNTRKLKKIFATELIFLYCFYVICVPRGNAESVSIVKDLGQIPVNNKKVMQAFDTGEKYHQTAVTEEETFTFEIAEERDFLKEGAMYEDYQSTVLEKEISSHNNEKNITQTPSGQDRPAQPAPEKNSRSKTKLNLWRFIIVSG